MRGHLLGLIDAAHHALHGFLGPDVQLHAPQRDGHHDRDKNQDCKKDA